MKNGTPKTKKIPERRCLGCGESFPKRELIRVVRSPEGTLSLDFTGKKAGRGAYICPSLSCFKKARKSGRIAKNLEVAVSEELFAELEHEVALSEAQKEELI